MANKAIIAAISHRNPQIEERDVIAAEVDYSQFALEALEVEAAGFHAPLIDMLFTFIGTEPILEAAQVHSLLSEAGVRGEHLDEAVLYLRSLSFLGVRVGEREFEYAEDSRDLAKLEVLAKRRLPDHDFSYAVHPAFRPYLEIEDPDLPPGQLSLG